MTEHEAKAWLEAQYGNKVMTKLDQYRQLLSTESQHHNLIAQSTIPMIWSRHLLDSAQLISHAPDGWKYWVDVGSGAGLPGLVVAIITNKRVTLIEPRRLRVSFLESCVDALSLQHVTIIKARTERASLDNAADVVSARAVTTLNALLAGTRHFTNLYTTYIFPKGKTTKSELVNAQRSWRGAFHVKHSIIDPESGIVVATGVSPR